MQSEYMLKQKTVLLPGGFLLPSYDGFGLIKMIRSQQNKIDFLSGARLEYFEWFLHFILPKFLD